MSKGTLILIVGLPGSGKGTLVTFAKKEFPEIIYPASWTTRPSRPGERDGDVYHFVSREEFQKAIEAHKFLEWVEIDGGHCYGTLREDFEIPLAEGRTVLREVEVAGARAIRSLLPDAHMVSIFVKVGDWNDLEQRIRTRAPISEEELTKRRERYEREILFTEEADFVLENQFGKITETQQTFAKLIRAILKN